MKKPKITLKRTRPERSQTRRLTVGKTIPIIISIAPEDKKTLQEEAKKKELSFSLYINLILHGQEKSPLS